MSLASKAKKHQGENAKRIAQLEKLVADQQAYIDRLKKPVRRHPARARLPKGGFTRLCVPDTHGVKCCQQAVDAMLADLKAIPNIKEVILLGDHIDCGGFLAEHHTLGYVDETDYSFVEDCAAANQFLDRLQEAVPKARVTYIEGNHEHRIERWIVTKIKNRKDAEAHRRMFGAEHVLALEKRGIEFIRRGGFYDGLKIRGTIRRGPCIFAHGFKTGPNAAKNHLRAYKTNCVFGHVHRLLSHVEMSAKMPQIGAWCPGCLCEITPFWRQTDTTDWAHGYGIQLVRDEEFLHINVPIIDGASLLSTLW